MFQWVALYLIDMPENCLSFTKMQRQGLDFKEQTLRLVTVGLSISLKNQNNDMG